jgi:regulator of sirC expression with transglutaminase-like and TPR domain
MFCVTVSTELFLSNHSSKTTMSVRSRLLAEINQPDRELNLARAALYIAQTEYPQLDVDEQLDILAEMATELATRLPQSRYPLRVIQTINDYLYDELGFVGNTDHYYDPRNSFLNDVLVRRTGIPLTLALVYLELAWRIDLPMVGIGMPGHFIIRPDFEGSEIFVDAFNRGEILFAEDCRQKLIQIYRQEILALPPEILQPVTKQQFLMRMLNNLQTIYLSQEDVDRALMIKDLLTLFR